MTKIFIIGRNPNAASGEIPIVVNDPSKKVSSNHCRVLYDNGNFYIEDLISTNGTYVDGEKVNSRTRVTEASRITLGESFPFSVNHPVIRATISSGEQIGNVNNERLQNHSANTIGPVNFNVGEIIKEGFTIGMRNFGSIAVSYILWLLTIWIPYINVGTTIAIMTLPLGLASNRDMGPVEIFDSKYRRQFGEFFLLLGLIFIGFVITLQFMVIPGLVLLLAWSQAPLILIDKKLNFSECLTVSNRITYGNKFNIFWVNLIMFFILMIGYLVFLGLGGLGIAEGFGFLIVLYVILVVYFLFWVAFSLGVQAMIYKVLSQKI